MLEVLEPHIIGTEIELEPMETMTAPMNNSPEAREVRKGTIRLVIADDHPIVRDGLKKLLLLEDDLDVVGEASDGREVLEKVRDLDPDVLLLDLQIGRAHV